MICKIKLKGTCLLRDVPAHVFWKTHASREKNGRHVGAVSVQDFHIWSVTHQALIQQISRHLLTKLLKTVGKKEFRMNLIWCISTQNISRFESKFKYLSPSIISCSMLYDPENLKLHMSLNLQLTNVSQMTLSSCSADFVPPQRPTSQFAPRL